MLFDWMRLSVLQSLLAIDLIVLVSASGSLYTDGQGNCNIPPDLIAEIAGYQPTVDAISEAITAGPYINNTWSSLNEFIDTFGPRLTGSAQLERSIDNMLGLLTEAGLQNVHTESVPVTRWERGYESAELLHPYWQQLDILGLGWSVGTPRGGIIADVVAVESFDEFDALSEAEVAGKIVLFVPQWEGYGKMVQYRRRAATLAASKGGVAALVRSVTSHSIGRPHTGMQNYATGERRVPVAALTVEDATMMLSLYRSGEPMTVRLQMSARLYPDPVTSRNTIAELHGSQFAANESVVVVSGHLDSWDVGRGAMDDAGGVFISWKAVEYLSKMGLRPRRTIRTVLWTGEEQDYLGSIQYKLDHAANEADEFNVFIESDLGTFEPTGLALNGNADAACLMQEIMKLMGALKATEFQLNTKGVSDIGRWTKVGFPGVTLLNRNQEYFWYHHTAEDSMLLETPENLDKAAALFAAFAYVVADLSVDFPRTLIEDVGEDDD